MALWWPHIQGHDVAYRNALVVDAFLRDDRDHTPTHGRRAKLWQRREELAQSVRAVQATGRSISLGNGGADRGVVLAPLKR
jgi:hypothetical protein